MVASDAVNLMSPRVAAASVPPIRMNRNEGSKVKTVTPQAAEVRTVERPRRKERQGTGKTVIQFDLGSPFGKLTWHSEKMRAVQLRQISVSSFL